MSGDSAGGIQTGIGAMKVGAGVASMAKVMKGMKDGAAASTMGAMKAAMAATEAITIKE
jgi:hypothetical protein